MGLKCLRMMRRRLTARNDSRERSLRGRNVIVSFNKGLFGVIFFVVLEPYIALRKRLEIFFS